MRAFSTMQLDIKIAETTEATVIEVRYGELVGSGYAKKHPKDAPNRETGRLVALSRALLNLQEEIDAEVDKRLHPPPPTMRDLRRHIREIFSSVLPRNEANQFPVLHASTPGDRSTWPRPGGVVSYEQVLPWSSLTIS